MSHPLQSVHSDEPLPRRADVVIIGAGIVGVSAALELARRGLKVSVLEKGQIAAEQSSRNWGWIRQQGRDRRELKLIVESLAIWERWQNEWQVDLGFRRTGLTSLTRSPAELQRWRRWASRARESGIEVRELSASEAEAALPSTAAPWIGGLLTPTDARAEPALAAPAIAEAARRAGATLHQQTAVRALELDEEGAIRAVLTEHGRIETREVLLAAGAWSSLFLRPYGIRLPQLNVRSTVARTSAAPAIISGAFLSSEFCLRRRLDHGFSLTRRTGESFDLVPDALRFLRDFLPLFHRNFRDLKFRFGRHFFASWRRERARAPDQVSVYETVRVNDPAFDQTEVRQALKNLKKGRPQLAGVEVEQAWAGRIDLTPDLVPVISRVDAVGGLTIATGFSGHGFGIGPGAGRLAADLVRRAEPLVNPEPFRLDRFAAGKPLFIDPDVI